MKITIYTTTDCQFSKAEKEYLTSHTLQFEEKNLETNKDFLTEMLAVSNNFAGTPVTRVEKDDGTIAVLKGFTKEEFDATFGLTATPATPPPVANEAPKTEETKPVEPTPGEVKPMEATPTAPASQTPLSDEKLNSVLDKLEEKTTPEATPPVETPPAPTEVVSPTIPTETPPTNAPSIPDFPAAAAKTTA
ncbi:hypothetical protein HZA76_00530 [Candidatus Roizmanbacteria bacterium]|nr:hypothetical protein [Candidatus Roizmanbacteria bacterium]